jgi:hypothetical protein
MVKQKGALAEPLLDMDTAIGYDEHALELCKNEGK